MILNYCNFVMLGTILNIILSLLLGYYLLSCALQYYKRSPSSLFPYALIYLSYLLGLWVELPQQWFFGASSGLYLGAIFWGVQYPQKLWKKLSIKLLLVFTLVGGLVLAPWQYLLFLMSCILGLVYLRTQREQFRYLYKNQLRGSILYGVGTLFIFVQYQIGILFHLAAWFYFAQVLNALIVKKYLKEKIPKV